MTFIPVLEVNVPVYKLKTFGYTNEKIDYPGTPWHNIKIPKIYWDNKPDFEKIGRQIDQPLKRHFSGRKVAIRALASEEHPGKSIDQLIEIIKDIGHDRYDPSRKGDRYENLENRHIDFFAIPFEINKEDSYFEHFVEPFYFWPIADRGKPIRVDIAIIYDLNQLEVVEHRYEGRENEVKRDGFVFRNRENKARSILGIIKIL